MPEFEDPVDPDGSAAAGNASVTAGESLTELREALEKAEATSADNWNRYLRAVAELDNARKRAARDVDAARRAGVEKLGTELLAIADSLELGLENAGNATVETLVAGKEATLRLLKTAFDKFGIEVVDPLGEPFDPQLHEAMSMLPSTTAEPGTVVVVMQKGYRLGDRLLRPARVIVAGEPIGSGAPADAPAGGDPEG